MSFKLGKISIPVFLLLILISSLTWAGTTSQYDDLHRLIRVERTDGSVTVYNYDDFGNRTSVVTTADTTAPTALISASPTAGSAPLTVFFTDQSVGEATSWDWDFGDGITSTLQNPSHIYQDPGTYSVSLTFDGGSGSDTVTQTNYIQVNQPVVEGELNLTPFNQNFFGIGIGNQTAAIDFVLSNGTSNTVDVYDLDIGGTNASDFVVVVDTCSNESIAPLNSCTVSVAFSPSAEGARRAILSLPTSFEDKEVVLTGTGYKAGSVEIPAFDAYFNQTITDPQPQYAFNLVAGQGVNVMLRPNISAGNLDLNLLDSSGNVLASFNDRTTYHWWAVEYTPQVSGTYYIRIDIDSGATGNFDLVVENAWFNPGVVDSDRELHTLDYTTQFIGNGTYDISGYNWEYFRFVAKAGQEFSITLEPAITAGNLDLNILDQYGTIRASSDNVYDGGVRTLSHTVAVDGVYYLRIDNDGAMGNFTLSVSAGLDTNVDTDSDGLFDAAEYYHGTDINSTDSDGDGVSDYDEIAQGTDPDNNYQVVVADAAVSLATAVTVPTFDVPFTVNTPSYQTWYKFDLIDGQGITVALTPHINQGNLDLNLFDSNGTLLTSWDGALNNETRAKHYTPVVGGTYYIRIDVDSGAYGSFDLAVYNAWFNAGVIDGQRKYYSNEYVARQLANGSYDFSGNVNDYFCFVAHAGQSFSITMTSAINTGSPDMNILDMYGNVRASYDGIGNGLTRTLTHTVAVDGVYYLRIDRDNSVGNFTLSVSAGLDTNVDTDSDGLFDAAEYYHGTDINSVDSDGDGVSDYEEIAQGTDPDNNYQVVVADSAVSLATAVAVPVFDVPFTVNTPSYQTWYKFDLIDGQGIAVALTPHINQGNLDLNLLDANGTLLTQWDGALNNETRVKNYTPVVGGTYYIRIDVDSGAYGSFDLAVYNAWFNADVVDGQRKYYSNEHVARQLANGSYDFSGNTYDYFRFIAHAGQPFSITMTSAINTGSPDMNILDMYGNVRASYDGIGNGLTRTLTHTVAVDGVYYLRLDRDGAIGNFTLSVSAGLDTNEDTDSDGLFDAAEHYHGTDINSADSDGDGVSDYDEIAQGTDPDSNYQVVVADSAVSLATAVAVPAFDVPFTVNTPSYQTWYKFDLIDGQGITVTLTPHINQGNLDLNLFDSNGTLLTQWDGLNDNATGYNLYTPTVGGTYYIRVDVDSGAYGSFDLAVYNAWFNAGVTDSQRESFSTQYTARQLASGSYNFSGQTYEFYRFVAHAGQSFSITMTSAINTGSPDMNILDMYGSVRASYDGIGNGLTRTLTHTVAVDGVYYLRIDRDNSVGNFTLSVSAGLDTNVDTDSDGLFDAAEYYHGTDINSADSDGDGVSDYDEIAQGTDPDNNYQVVVADSAVSLATAVAVPAFDVPFTVNTPSYQTWYKFDLIDGQGITVALTPHINLGNLDLNLFDSNGALLTSWDGALNNETRANNYTPVVGGTYYVRVDVDGGAYGSFDLAVYNAWFNVGTTDCQREYYSSLNVARYLISRSYHLSGNTYEFYRFVAQAGQEVSITLSPTLNQGNLDLNILNSDGSRLAYSDNVSNGQIRTINYIATVSDDYYLRLDRDSGAYGNYDLTVAGIEDSDLDGMQDEWEYFYFCGIHREGPGDYDGDLLTDLDEHDNSTNPLLIDTESDGMPDGWEVFNLLDPLVNDAGLDPDSDALTNLGEYQNNTDPHDPDTEDDGMTDGWEVSYNLDPLADDRTGDPDLDTLYNITEFGLHTSPRDSDTDNDGMPDGWEVGHSLNPVSNDGAEDPDLDSLSNLGEYNADTDPHDADTDNDGMQDGWEVLYGLNPVADDSDSDFDHDTLSNIEEFGLGTNPANADTDADLMPDGWEVVHNLNPLSNDAAADPDADNLSNLGEYQAFTDPALADTDADLMPDGWEVNNDLAPLVNDAAADPDSDNLMNLQEYQASTNPHNPDTDADGLLDGSDPDPLNANTSPEAGDDVVLVSEDSAEILANLLDNDSDVDGDFLRISILDNTGTLGAISLVKGTWTPTLPLSGLDGSNGFVVNGLAGDYSGFAVNSAGDVNGDGYDDLIIGANHANPDGEFIAGETYLVFGKADGFGSSFDLASLDGSNGFVITGIDTRDESGHSVSGAGDVNGDGLADLVIGAYVADPNGIDAAGESYVIFGKSSGFSSALNLSTLDGHNGFVINGIDVSDYSGYSVSGAGDVNGDGYADLLIGAPYADPNDNSAAGESYVVFGHATGFAPEFNLSTLDGINGFVIHGVDAEDGAGVAVSTAGDVNGDGYADLLIGAPSADPNDIANAGKSYVLFGTASGFSATFDLSGLEGTNGFIINGINAGDRTGSSVKSAGDVNGDGFSDVIIGTFNNPKSKCYVVFGKETDFTSEFNLADLDGHNGFVMTGSGTGEFYGYSVSGAGDVNSDGFDDLVIGAHWAAPNGDYGAGESYVVFGKGSDFESSLDLLTLDGNDGFVINGIDGADFSGRSVSGAGDINSDGFADLLIGAWAADPYGNLYAGETYVIFGSSGIGGGVEYDPTGQFDYLGAGETALDSFTYTVSDGFATTFATVTVVVSGTNDAPVFAGIPTITGMAMTGQLLSLADISTDDAEDDTVGLTFQWLADGLSISSATESTYLVASSDIGKALSCSITASDGNGGSTLTTTSEVTAFGDTTAPVVNTFSVPMLFDTLDLSGIILEASDDVGVTGYLITESTIIPSPESVVLASPPTSYSVQQEISEATPTAVFLYAWVRDAVGNVSTAATATVIVNLPDTSDTDQDGIADNLDNCPMISNPDQNDANDNGIGNACDDGDTDGDGLSDAEEYVLGSDPGIFDRTIAWLTPETSTLYMTIFGNAVINTVPIDVGDEISVFDSQGVLCGHEIVDSTGSYGNLFIYGDDPATSTIDEGAEVGELLRFKVWDASTRQVMWAESSPGTVHWVDSDALPVDLNGLTTTDGWSVHNTDISQGMIDWLGVEHSSLTHTSYVRIRNQYYYVYNSATTSPLAGGGEDYTYATLLECNQLTGEPAPGPHDQDGPQWADLTNLQGGAIETFSHWQDIPDLQVHIELREGWNLISIPLNNLWYIGDTPPEIETQNGQLPEQITNINDLLNSINGQYDLLRGFDAEGAKTYAPDIPENLNSLDYLAGGYGYWIKMNTPGTLSLTGQAPYATDSLQLHSGWNLIGHWGGDEKQVATGEGTSTYVAETLIGDDLATIIDSIELVRGFDEEGAKTYDPAIPENLNTLHTLKEGQGYWIKLNQNEILNFAP